MITSASMKWAAMPAENDNCLPISWSITSRSMSQSLSSSGIDAATDRPTKNSTMPSAKIGFFSRGTSRTLEIRLPIAVSMQAKA